MSFSQQIMANISRIKVEELRVLHKLIFSKIENKKSMVENLLNFEKCFLDSESLEWSEKVEYLNKVDNNLLHEIINILQLQSSKEKRVLIENIMSSIYLNLQKANNENAIDDSVGNVCSTHGTVRHNEGNGSNISKSLISGKTCSSLHSSKHANIKIKKLEILAAKKKLQLEAEIARINQEKKLLELDLEMKKIDIERAELNVSDDGETINSIQSSKADNRVHSWLNNNNFLEYNDDYLDHESNVSGRQLFSNKKQSVPTKDEKIDIMMARQTFGESLPSFSGDSREWPVFIGKFNRTTMLCKYSDEENMERLNKCLRGKARDVVKSMLQISTDCNAALRALERNFGRADQIIEKLVEEIQELAPVTNESTFMQLTNSAMNLVVTSESLGGTFCQNNIVLLKQMVNKLPNMLRLSWGEHNRGRSTSIKNLSQWLFDKAEIISEIGYQEEEAFKKLPLFGKKVDKEEKGCLVCGKTDHNDVLKCNKFKSLNVKQRWDMATKLRLCFRCLKIHKGVCAQELCGINGCSRNHHKLLHKEQFMRTASNENETRMKKDTVATASPLVKNPVMLKMIPVRIRGPKATLDVIALLDDGSTITLINAAVAESIGLEGEVSPFHYQLAGSEICTNDNSKVVDLELSKSKSNAKFHKLSAVRTIEELNISQEIFNIDELAKKYLCLSKEDLQKINNQKISILIGQDNCQLIAAKDTLTPDPYGPMLSRTKLGWVIHGPISQKINNAENSLINMCCEHQDNILQEIIKQHISLENFGVVKTKVERQKSEEDRLATEMGENNICFKNGHYEMVLPYKDNLLNFPESYKNAMKRLCCTEMKLLKLGKVEQYSLQIANYVRKNYAKRVALHDMPESARKKLWYLPHFPVVNLNKPEKLRMVFDAASKSNGKCLNDFLITGPDLLTSLPGILMRFRKGKFAFAGDVREMFHQVKIQEEDCWSQCFLWRNMNRLQRPEIYQMSVMIFGASSSPFMANFAKNYNAQQYSEEFPDAAQEIFTQFYVDDYISSADTVEEALKLIKDVIKVNSNGGFELRNFISNSDIILEKLGDAVSNKISLELRSDMSMQRVLGMHWNASEDYFTFSTKFVKVDQKLANGDKMPTKRDALKLLMSLFDPLGLISPVTVNGKVILQQIWKKGIGWDDEIGPELHAKWLDWLKQMKKLAELRIPRHYCQYPWSSIELHIFCDASEEAYAAVAYLRFLSANKYPVSAKLIMSKCRVAPVKQITIPKMELQAAVLGVRIIETIRKELKMNIDSEHCWSDSRTVLSWIESSKKRQSFVAVRIGEILEITDAKSWNWIPTKLNIADYATRSTKNVELKSNSEWFLGPQFLMLPDSDWPRESFQSKNKLIFLEECNVLVTENKINFELLEVSRFSSWTRLVRSTSWMLRFLNNIKKEKALRICGKELLPSEVNAAEILWYKQQQLKDFGENVKKLRDGNSVKNTRLKNFNIMLDENDILRVQGRIQKAELGEFTKNPIILDSGSQFVELLIMKYHCHNFHQGTETIVNQLRQKYWILNLRNTIKKVIYKCQYCKIRNAKPNTPIMGQLPEFRLKIYERPFMNIGIDYFGPLDVTVGRRREKRYGVLFTCLNVRAIHIELASSLSTDSAILALRRFISRRGQPIKIYSDNGTNFCGANKELQKSFKDLCSTEIQNEILRRGIEWHFIPPQSPHMGGAWERLIQSVKKALYTILKERAPRDEVLNTLLTEVEQMVNSRPLTFVSSDPEDFESLTPNHFLIGPKNEIHSVGVFSPDDEVLRKQWRISQLLSEMYWKRWLKEYIPTLVKRNKWYKSKENLVVGDVVVIYDEINSRGNWPIGVIIKCYPGNDGVVRVVNVKTAYGTYLRPVVKVAKIGNACSVNKPDHTREENIATIPF